MKTVFAILMVTSLLCAPGALAFLDTVTAPPQAEAGHPVAITITGGMPDGCWGFLGHEVAVEGTTLTVTLNTLSDPPEGVVCTAAIVDYQDAPEITFPAPGQWTLRVVERAVNVPYGYLDQFIWEGEVTVTGATAGEWLSLGALKTRYR